MSKKEEACDMPCKKKTVARMGGGRRWQMIDDRWQMADDR
jgi:hypothetical protein